MTTFNSVLDTASNIDKGITLHGTNFCIFAVLLDALWRIWQTNKNHTIFYKIMAMPIYLYDILVGAKLLLETTLASDAFSCHVLGYVYVILIIIYS